MKKITLSVGILLIVALVIINGCSQQQTEIRYVCPDGSEVLNRNLCASCGDDICNGDETATSCSIDCDAVARNGRKPTCSGSGLVYDSDGGRCLRVGTTS